MLSTLFALALWVAPSYAAEEFTPPALTGPVVDSAGMLSAGARDRLERFIRALHESGGTQLQVATVPNLGGLSIEEASIKVVDQWKLGSAGADNGVLLLVARDERKVRIEVGQGREGELTDAYSSRIIRDVIVPRFKSGDFDRGILEGVAAIIHYTDPGYLKDREGGRPRASRSEGSGGIDLQTLLMIFFFTFLLLPSLFGRRRRRGGFWTGLGAGYGLGGGFGRGGGFGSGGGGWSGGGGGFSGGGASGSW